MLMFVAGVLVAQTPATLLDETKAGTNGQNLPSNLVAAIVSNGGTSTQNFVVQAGSASWSGVYGTATSGSGWITISSTGDTEKIDIWCDIEMYLQTNIANNLIYFHEGNLATLGDADKVAYVQGSFTGNNGQYIGLATDTGCDITKLKGAKDLIAMGSRDVTLATGYAPIPVAYTLADQGSGYTGTGHSGVYRVPDDTGYGDQNSVEAVWWLINGGAPGNQLYEWKVTISPAVVQPDGHYKLDPVVVFKPAL